MRIIAISGKRRSGKTTLANILRQEYGYVPMSLASPLKHMVREQFGLTYEQTDGYFKEQPTHLYDRSLPGRTRFLTPRDLMISFGQYYRSIDENYWISRLVKDMESYDEADAKTFVVADVRFKNELAFLKKQGALAVRLERDEQYTGTNINDPSETQLDDYKDWDILIPASHNVAMDDLYVAAEVINAHLITA